MLEDHADLAACQAQRAVVQRGQVLAGDDHATAGGPVQQVDGAYQRALAGAAAADDAEDFARCNRQADVPQCMHVARRAREALRQSLQFDHVKVTKRKRQQARLSRALLPHLFFMKPVFYAIRFIP
ncbi:hypothetical protein D3C72_1782120 [compost metagenome]